MFTKNIEEKRTTTRLTFNTKVCIVDDQQNEIAGRLQNLSATGVSVKTGSQLNTGSNCNLSIIIEGTNSNLTINKLAAKVVRSNKNIVGLKFNNTMEWLTLFYVYKKKFNIDEV